jgi:type IV pilus assembly protein PilA
MYKKRLGFTLVELITVVIIIGILAAIAIPVFLNQRKAAWKASVISDVSNAQLVTETASTGTNGVIDGMTFKKGTHESPLEIVAAGKSYESTVSPGNTISEAIGKTANGAACYLITGKNENLDGYIYKQSSIVNASDCIVPDTTYTTETLSFKTYSTWNLTLGHWSILSSTNDGISVQDPVDGYAQKTYVGSGQSFSLKPGDSVSASVNSTFGSLWPSAKKGDEVALTIPVSAWINSDTGKDMDTRSYISSVSGITGGSWQMNCSHTDYIWFNGGTWDGGDVVLTFRNGSSLILKK